MRKLLLAGVLFYLIGCATSPHKSSVKIYIEQKNAEKAILEGQKWVADEPQNPQAHLWLGVAYVLKKDYQNAAESFVKAFELDPNLKNPQLLDKTFTVGGIKLFTADGVATTLQNGGTLASKEGKNEEAVKYLRTAIELFPDKAQLYLLLSATYQKMGEDDMAKKVLEEGTMRAPDNKDLLYYYALMLVSEKDYDRALENLKRAVEIDSTFGKAYYEMGVIYFEKGDNEKAFDLLKKATALEPDNKDAWFSLGVVSLKLNKFDEAQMAFKKYTELNPDDAQGWFYLGASYYEGGKYEEALQALDKSDQLNPGDPDVYNYKGLVYKKMGDTKKALEMFRRASELEKGKGK